MTEPKDLRLPALRRFAFAITLLNVLGHTVLGFEQSWAAPLVGIGAAYAAEIGLELIAAWQQGRRPRFLAGGPVGAVDFLLSAHITGLAVSMLLYTGERLAPIAFAAVVAIGSKYIFRAPAPAPAAALAAGKGPGSRHFLNPSNFGITQPYMFTEKLNAIGSWVLPAVLVCAGSFLNGRFTHKLPLIAGWVGGFVLQALVRWGLFGNLPLASLMPLTGVALLLFTFYMVTDPATTPVPAWRQVGFGAAVAATYGVLLAAHVVFTPFFALTVVAMGRGALQWAAAWRRQAVARRELAAARPQPATAMHPPAIHEPAAAIHPPAAAIHQPAAAQRVAGIAAGQ